MKEIYAVLEEILTGDARLRGLLGYEQSKDIPIGKEGLTAGVSGMNIRRGFQTEGKWSKLLTYFFQPDSLQSDFSPNIRRQDLVFVIFDRESDLNLFDVAERVIELLDEQDSITSNLTVDRKLHSYGCYYAGQIETPSYDEIQKSYRMSLRFYIYIRKEIA
jgi:hypothetical protein